METKINLEELEKENSNPNSSKYPCRNAIGNLMYAMICTRPDLSFTVSLLSRFQTKQSDALWKLIKRVLRYLKNTINYQLVFKKDLSASPIIGYVDASFGTNDLQAHSTSGYILKLFNKPIIWVSRRQDKVALSTMIVEYYALCEITRDIIWLRQCVQFLGIHLTSPTTIFEDNASCIAITKNPVKHKGTRELDTRLFFVRDELNKTITLTYIPSSENLADLFTKALPKERLVMLSTKINLS